MKFLLLIVGAICAVASGAEAASFSLYSKTGYMDWKERENGRQFIRETGPTQEFGVAARARKYSLGMDGSIGVWGSVLGYDGRSAETSEPRKMTTGDFGGKGALLLSVPLRAGEKLGIAPLGGTAINYFRRSVGPETWLVLTARAGARIEAGPVELLAGVMYPYKTSSTIDWTGIGAAGKVTVAPRGMATPFVEAKAKFGSWRFGMFYEPLRWAASREAPFSYTGDNPSAAIATATGIYQPETRVQHLGFSLDYYF